MKRYGQILISIDQLMNTLLGGWADESYSARSYRERRKHPWRVRIIDGLFFFQKDHCLKSYSNEKRRLQSPPSERRLPIKK